MGGGPKVNNSLSDLQRRAVAHAGCQTVLQPRAVNVTAAVMLNGACLN